MAKKLDYEYDKFVADFEDGYSFKDRYRRCADRYRKSAKIDRNVDFLVKKLLGK